MGKMTRQGWKDLEAAKARAKGKGAKGYKKPRTITSAPKSALSAPIVLPDLSKKSLYLAYGSNLHIKAMTRRCPDAKPCGKYLLENARLVFRGVADIDYAKNHLAPVGVWRISEADEHSLDRYEGVAHGLYHKFWLETEFGPALLYLMNDRHGIHPPSAWYAATIRDGYRNFGLEEAFLDEAIKHSYVNVQVSEQVESRRRRQIQKGENSLVKMPEVLRAKNFKFMGA
jgi:hypothetical protein